MSYTQEELLKFKKDAEEKQTKHATLKGKMEAVASEVKKQFNVSSTKELKELSESLQVELTKANTEYETACEAYREKFDV